MPPAPGGQDGGGDGAPVGTGTGRPAGNPGAVGDRHGTGRVAIMQPYFFPYLGYFALVHHSESWIVFDTCQYTPKTWMNRNRVLDPAGGWTYITVPVAGASRSTTLAEVRIADPARARAVIRGTLSHFRRTAPHFDEVAALVEETFAVVGDDDSLVAWNVAGMRATCRRLGLAFEPEIWSRSGIDVGPVDHPGGWAPAIARAVGAGEYINPASGRHLFDHAEFAAAGVDLAFLEYETFVYNTGRYGFEPDLSILDVLLWNEPEAVVAGIRRGATVRT